MVSQAYNWMKCFENFDHLVFVFGFFIKQNFETKTQYCFAQNPFSGDLLMESPIIL